MAYRFGALRDFALAAPFDGDSGAWADIGPNRLYRPSQWREGETSDWTGSGHIAALATPSLSIVADGDTQTASLRCGCPACLKSLSSKDLAAFVPDGVGAVKPAAPATPTTLITLDGQPGDTSTTSTLTVDGPSVTGTIDTIGDQDFYRIELEAGQSYEIGMYLKVGGPSLIPLADCYVEIYDAGGNLVVSADGGGPNTPSGLDVLMTFTAEYSGTYYINARAFDNAPEDGDDGDLVGDYELFARVTDGFSYQPYYSPDSPLYSIDWGSQVDGSSRNPDGEEGPRVTGNAFTGVGWNPYGIEGKNVITYYLAKTGEIYLDEDPTTPGTTDTMVAKGWSDWEIDALNLAFDAYEAVADIVYVEVDNAAEADFVFVTYNGTPGPGVSLLGRMSPPDEENEGRGEFNALDERWTPEGLAPGGFTFTTLIHEMGHGHGLAHPHDNGGRSGVMRGVESEGVAFDYTNGDFDLNQSIYTMMSYEDGWQTSPYGQTESTDPYGWLGSLMAFDVAAIQDKYGVNEDYRTGDDVYVIQDENAAGTFYSCIWDAGGDDEIRYLGSRDAVIDLRAATLKYEYGGGGWLSYAYGLYGGFTIANGVVIENATGGGGDDAITGNDANNSLRGWFGDDAIAGGAGDDVLTGDDGADVLDGGAGNDRLFGGAGDDVLGDLDDGADALYGDDGADTLTVVRGEGSTAAVLLDGGLGDDRFVLAALSGSVTARGGEGADRFETRGVARIEGGAGVDRIVLDAAYVAGLVVADFAAGAGGDRLDLDAWLSANLEGWDGAANPFTSGFLRLVTSGADTLVQVDVDGGGDGWSTLARLESVAAASLTVENLGYAPAPASTVVTGTAGADTLTGGDGPEIINGLDGGDTIKGQGGDDEIHGDGGADRLYGGAGDDAIDGGAGADRLYGGAGRDVLAGGSGGDVFVFQTLGESTPTAPDRVVDFNAGEGDLIDLRAIDADTGRSGNQAFHFVDAFGARPGEATLDWDEAANLSTLRLDVNGDGVADFLLQLEGQVGTGAGWML